MFYVWQHTYGRKRIARGPAEGLLEWPQHQWQWFARFRKKADAIQAATNHGMHSTVTYSFTSDSLFDNGKEPGIPEGWWPATAQTVMDARQ